MSMLTNLTHLSTSSNIQIGQPFTNSNFHFLIIVDTTTFSQNQFPPLVLRSHPSLARWADRRNCHHGSHTILELCTIFWGFAFITPSPHNSIILRSVSITEACFARKTRNHATNFLPGPGFFHCVSIYPLDVHKSDDRLLCHLLHSTPTTRCSTNASDTPGNLTYRTRLVALQFKLKSRVQDLTFHTHHHSCNCYRLVTAVRDLFNQEGAGIDYKTQRTAKRLRVRGSNLCRSQWPSGLRRGSAADRLLGLRVRIVPGGMDVCVVCCKYRRKAKCRTIKTKKQVRMKYRVQKNTKKNRGWCEIFSARPDRPWGPPILLYDGYRVSFTRVKRPGRGANHPPPSSPEVKDRVELHLHGLFYGELYLFIN